MHDKDTYFVAVKAFLLDGDGNLLITKDVFNDGWDIPGGRLRGQDFNTSLEDVVERKIREELGNNVEYKLEQPVVFMRHEREEIYPSGEKGIRRIFAVGYEARYLGGEITLGKSHEKYEWVSLKDFVPENYFVGGWLKGVKEFQSKYGK